MKYKSVVVTKRGGPEVLQVVENDLRSPSTNEACIKILAAPVSAPDISTRYGQSLFIPKFPFMLGNAVIGDVEAVGEGVTGVAIGDRVAALTAYGGYAEHLYCRPLIGSLGRAGQTAVHRPRSS